MVGWMPGFFDIEERLRELSAKGDDLECIKGLVNFGKFRADLEAAVPRADRSRGGRPPFDHVFMFKVLILQTMHALSDERCEYLIKDRLSFMRFLGLGLADPVPDANTIWTFREALKKAKVIDALSSLRRGAESVGLSCYGWTDRRRHHYRRSQAAQHRGREEGDQGGAHTTGLEGQARETAPGS